MTPRIAGKNAKIHDQIGFLNGDMSQPRSAMVGFKSLGTSNFGVDISQKKSSNDIEKIAIITAKSLTN